MLLTLFKPTEKELNYWINIYNKWNSKEPRVYFLIDGTDISLKGIINEDYVYKSEENLGKMNLVYRFIKNTELECTHIKICDPDDYISINAIKEIEEEMDTKVNCNDDLIFFKLSNLEMKKQLDREKGEEIYCGADLDSILKDSISMRKHSRNFANSWTIFPYRPLKEDKLFSQKRIDFADDQILGFICLANGSKIVETDKVCYLYKVEYGVSSTDNTPFILKTVIEAFKEVDSLLAHVSELFDVSWPNISYYERKMNMFLEGKTLPKEELKEINDSFINLQNYKFANKKL